MRIKSIYCLLFFLAGCASFEMPATFQHKTFQTQGFEISLWQKSSDEKAPYYVYIEGDGHAFNAHGRPTSDPTPHSSLMRKLAATDTHANVVYLARPCQFSKGVQCAQKYWTTARFAPEVIEAEYEALKQITHHAPVVLIGYSGGAQVAGLIALKKDLNIQKIITIAGNLDHKAWTEYHRLPALSQSLNLADSKEKFALMEQLHYVGAKDKVIPPILTEQFVGDKNKIVVLPSATHAGGWDNIKIP